MVLRSCLSLINIFVLCVAIPSEMQKLKTKFRCATTPVISACVIYVYCLTWLIMLGFSQFSCDCCEAAEKENLQEGHLI